MRALGKQKDVFFMVMRSSVTEKKTIVALSENDNHSFKSVLLVDQTTVIENGMSFISSIRHVA